ncbi:MAG: tRNA (adenosine(37)-N6)-threonylcarbamoyltransferase complex ATPase subunit type 1 TsaE, partial [Nevskiales bacterium]
DLYRLSAAEELEYLGLRDLDPGRDLILIEWPERGHDGLPPPDLTIWLDYLDMGRPDTGRKVRVDTGSERGTTIHSGLPSDTHLI